MGSYLLAFLVICTFILAEPSSAADDGFLWRIGNPDNSFAEFALVGDYSGYTRAFGGGVRFEVGKSDPARAWPFIQPGPVDAWAGSKAHTQQIVFDLDGRPEGVYLLQVDLVDVHSAHAPTLVVGINDRKQTFRLRAGVSDVSISDPANGREQIVRMYVRASALRAGRNVVSLTITRGSWALYDCISLGKCAAPPRAVDNVSIRPSCLFKKTGGRLMQVVKVSTDCLEGSSHARIELTGDKGLRASQTVRDIPGGRSEVEVLVPEVSEAQNVRARVTIGGDTAEGVGVVTPQKRWKIYLMPSTHLDIGYTGRQDLTMDTHRENLARAIEWCKRYPGFVWDLEGSLVAEDYLLKSGKPSDLIDLARKGRIGIMGFYGNELTGICSSEGLTRLVDYYDSWRNEFGVESRCAMQTDVPTMVATVPMILAGHGIKYLSHGVNATRARPDQELYNTPHYWESPDGSRVLLWKTPGYGQTASITGYGADADIDAASERIDDQLRGYIARKDYPFDAILLHGGYGDNQPNGEAIARLPDEWNRRYEHPKLIFTRGPEFFEYIAANFSKDLKTVKGDGGVWWEDGAGSSARETAITRVAKEQLSSAEKLSVLCGKEARERISRQVSDAWREVLMYDEHTWGAAQSIDAPDSKATREQWAVKKQFADRAAVLAGKAYNDAAKAFADTIRAEADSVVVFNPSSWTRSEWMKDTARCGGFLADSVPPMGYKVFTLPPATEPPAPVVQDNTLDNRFYAIRFDTATGAVTSIYDKELKRELVDSSRYGVNQYLYASGGENGRVLNFDTGSPLADIAVRICEGASLVKSREGRGQAMKVTCAAPMTSSFEASVILYDDVKRIDFTNTLDKNPNLAKEAGYFAFPFAFNNPAMRLEIPDGVIRPELDQLPAACRDWYCVQHFLTVSDGSAAVVWTPLDSPLVTLQDIERGQWYDHIKIENGNVFAYVFNNYWFTNYKATQSGRLTFRFSMTSGRSFTDAEAKRFGESVQSPMVCEFLDKGSSGDGASERSFVSVDRENVVIQAVTPARFTEGTVIRLREMNGRTGAAKLRVDGIGFRRAYLCNLAEDRSDTLAVTNGTIEVPCRALGLTTVLLER